MAEDLKLVENEEDNDYVVLFKKPFMFEGKEYTSIDLSSLEDLSGEDLCEAYRRLTPEGISPLLAEQSPVFAKILASAATNMPIEFFAGMPARELNKIKNRVSRYFFAQD